MAALYIKDGKVFRVLHVEEGKVLVIDCSGRRMPFWMDAGYLNDASESEEDILDKNYLPFEDLPMREQKTVNRRYRIVCGILPFLKDVFFRCRAVSLIAEQEGISTQTVKNYLITFLIYQDKASLAPRRKNEHVLTDDEKNYRYALNKYYYSYHKNTLKYAYTMMLRDRYCDASGTLLPEYPSYDRFRYFYRKNKSLQQYYISREGLSAYQKDFRPLLGDGVQTYAGSIGVGMFDSTVCDIYLVNEQGEVVGRPLLTAAVDCYSGICYGYALSWEGGMYSVGALMENIVTDKVEHCNKFGITISADEWNVHQVPLTVITDKGTEYASENFSQIVDYGIEIINLPPYRPDLKGPIERFFGIVQDYFKPYLRGKGVIENNFQKRGARDYRKDSAFTLRQFEMVLLRCILFYNNHRILEDFPYTEKLLQEGIKPYSSDIWNHELKDGAALITVTPEKMHQVLLPRTVGKYGRHGLKVNGMHYDVDGHAEDYLRGGTVSVAYDPQDVSKVFLVEEDNTPGVLIERRFSGKSLTEIEEQKKIRMELISGEKENMLQAEIDLSNHILAIRKAAQEGKKSIKGIRANRQGEMKKERIKG